MPSRTSTSPRATDGSGAGAGVLTGAGAGAAPRVADGVELVGEYEGSGYREPHFLARRADGQVVQLTELLYRVADACDGECTWEEIAERVSAAYGKVVHADDVRYLVTEKLRPLGLLVDDDGSQPSVAKADPLLALRFRIGVVPARATKALARPFTLLFWPPVVVAVLAAFVAMDVWLLGRHGVGDSVRELLYRPATILLIFGLVVVSAAFHELGHAAACRYGGAQPGRMGAGLYLAWPAFFTDVTDAYRLGRRGRLRTDLGGVYFNTIFCLVTVGVYVITGFEPLLVLVGVQHFEMIHQLLPVLRLDGYYVLADATGVPDLFARIRPILRSMLPWRRAEPSVRELKPRVRLAVTAWVLVIVPVLAYLVTTMVLKAPRVLATAWDSMGVQWGATGRAMGRGDVLGAIAAIVQLIALGLPSLGIVVSIQRLARRVATGSWRWSAGSPVRRGVVVVAATAVVGFAAVTLWPNGEYRPLQRGEGLVVGDTLRDFTQVRTGRPSLTPDEAEAAGMAPSTEPSSPIGDESTSVSTSTTIASSTTTTDATTSTTARRAISSSPAPTSTSTSTSTTVEPTTTTTDATTTTEVAP